MANDIRIGVLGVGKMGFVHCEQIASTPGLKLVSASSRSPALTDAVENRFGIRTYNCHERLVEDPEVDWVVIATSTNEHKENALNALSMGKELIVEKPIALSYQDAREIFETAEKKGLRVTVHQNRRWDLDFELVQKVWGESLIGEVYRIESKYTDYDPCWGAWGAAGSNDPWRQKKNRGGGLLNDWGAHLFDQLLLLTDSEVKTVFGKLNTVCCSGEVDDYFWAEVLFEDGVSALVEVSHNHRIPAPRWYLVGTEGTLRVEGGNPSEWNSALICKKYGRFPQTIELDISHSELSIGYYQQFRDAVASSSPLPVLPRQVLRTMRLVDALRESDKRNRSVDLE